MMELEGEKSCEADEKGSEQRSVSLWLLCHPSRRLLEPAIASIGQGGLAAAKVLAEWGDGVQ
jgi:hypothetical protein